MHNFSFNLNISLLLKHVKEDIDFFVLEVLLLIDAIFIVTNQEHELFAQNPASFSNLLYLFSCGIMNAELGSDLQMQCPGARAQNLENLLLTYKTDCINLSLQLHYTKALTKRLDGNACYKTLAPCFDK